MSAWVVAVGASGVRAEQRVGDAVDALAAHPALRVLAASGRYQNPAVGGVTCARFVEMLPAAVMLTERLIPFTVMLPAEEVLFSLLTAC
mgnify:CR=1 FL=1